MYVHNITFYDLNGTQRNEDLHFNLNTIELTRLSAKLGGGQDLNEYITAAQNSGDSIKIINTLADIVLQAYGKKSEDGRRFIKNEQIREEFESSVMFAEFLEQLMLDDKLAIEFTTKTFESKVVNQALANAGGITTGTITAEDINSGPVNNQPAQSVEAALELASQQVQNVVPIDTNRTYTHEEMMAIINNSNK